MAVFDLDDGGYGRRADWQDQGGYGEDAYYTPTIDRDNNPYAKNENDLQQWRSAYDAVVAAYQEWLGRTPTTEEVLSHLSGGRHYQWQNIEAAVSSIRNSEEARARGSQGDALGIGPERDPYMEYNESTITPGTGTKQFTGEQSYLEATLPGSPITPTSPVTPTGTVEPASSPSGGRTAQGTTTQGTTYTPPPITTPTYTAPSIGGGGRRSVASPPARPSSTTYVPGTLPTTSLPGYNPFQFSWADVPTYQAGTLPTTSIPAYTPFQFTQFQLPEMIDKSGGQALALLNTILANPRTMTDEAVAMLKEQQKESLLDLQQQALDAALNRSAARGTVEGGAMEAYRRNLADAFAGDLTSGYRDIELARLERDRQDELAALEASTSLLGGMTDRATQVYEAQLAGEKAQAAEHQLEADYAARAVEHQAQIAYWQEQLRVAETESQQEAARIALDREQAQADEDYREYQAQKEAIQFDLQRAIEQEGLAQAGAASGLAGYNADLSAWESEQQLLNELEELAVRQAIAEGQLGLGYSQLSENARQFGLGHELDWAQLNASIEQQGLDRALRQELGLGEQELGWANFGLSQSELEAQIWQFLVNKGLA